MAKSELPSVKVFADVMSQWLEKTLRDDLEALERDRLGIRVTSYLEANMQKEFDAIRKGATLDDRRQ